MSSISQRREESLKLETQMTNNGGIKFSVRDQIKWVSDDYKPFDGKGTTWEPQNYNNIVYYTRYVEKKAINSIAEKSHWQARKKLKNRK